jgi:hypothetical protein
VIGLPSPEEFGGIDVLVLFVIHQQMMFIAQHQGVLVALSLSWRKPGKISRTAGAMSMYVSYLANRYPPAVVLDDKGFTA